MECQTEQEYYYSYIEKDFQSIPPERLEHIRSCGICLARIAELEQAVNAVSPLPRPLTDQHLALHFRLLDQWVDCDTIKPFLPLLAIQSLPVHIDTPVTAHVASCPACRADMDRLLLLNLDEAGWVEAARVLTGDVHSGNELSRQAKEILGAIGHRANSGILTRAAFTGGKEDTTLYIETIVPKAARPEIRMRRTVRLTASGLAAAVMLFAVLLFIEPHSATALELQEFYNSLSAVKNLSIRTTIAEEDEAVQSIWVCQERGLVLVDSPEKAVLVNINSREMLTRNKPVGLTRLEPGNFVVPEFLHLPWGLLPFKDITVLPDGVGWKQIDVQDGGRIVVYELSWTETLSSGRTIDRKWTGSLQRDTHLPEKIEWYERLDNQLPYTLRMTMEITYPKTYDVIEAMRSAGLELPYGDQR